MLKTIGFVLRRNDYREFDRIYTIYTSDFGKMSLLVRGAKKIKSKLSPALENFDKIRIDFAKGKIFNHLSGSSAGAENKNIFCDAEAIALSRDCLYLIDRFIKPEESDLRIFNLINEVLGAITNIFSVIPSGAAAEPRNLTPQNKETDEISRCARNDMIKIKIYFFWKLVEYLGYEPRLDECALCGKIEYPPPLFRGEDRGGVKNLNSTPSAFGISPSLEGERNNFKFNITDNIIICSNCMGEGIKIEEKTLENLRKIFTTGLMEFLEIGLDPSLSAITEKARQIKLSEL